MIRAIILDNDGTMRDSRGMIRHAYAETFKHFDAPMPNEQQLAENMYAGPELFFARFAHGNDPQELTAYYRSVLKGVLDKIHAYEGVLDTLKALHDMGIRLAVVSSSKFAKNDVAADGFDAYLDVVVDGHMISKSKPDPEGALLALKMLNVNADEAISIGDLPADVELGKAAKLKATVAITHGFATRHLLEQSSPDYIIDEFPDLIRVVKSLR